jgi:murein DD-endopeptidase MepM/ murein hydrolase activator NlpD
MRVPTRPASAFAASVLVRPRTRAAPLLLTVTALLMAVAVLLLTVTALLMAVAPAARAGEPAPSWRWPLDPVPRVVAGFDAPAGPYAAGHRGVDLAAGVGQPVRSAGAGVVSFAGRVAGRGVVSVTHPSGLRTTYEPVTASVTTGATVRAGQALGTVSAAPGHCLPATCLHWGLRDGDTYLDPLGLLGAVRVRLLPVWAPAGPGTLPRAGPGALTLTRAGPGVLSPAAGGAASSPDRGPLMAGTRW